MTATILTISIGLGALALIASGLLREKEAWDPYEEAGRLPALRKRREKLLRAIKDLDLARESGACSAPAAARLRSRLKAEAVAVSREVDRLRNARLRKLGEAGLLAGKARASRIEETARVEEAIRLRRAALREVEMRGLGSSGGESP